MRELPQWRRWKLRPYWWGCAGFTSGPLLGPHVLRVRLVVERFRDWRGRLVRLSCGHIIRDVPEWTEHRLCEGCRLTGRGGEVPELHDIRCGCGPCMGTAPAR